MQQVKLLPLALLALLVVPLALASPASKVTGQLGDPYPRTPPGTLCVVEQNQEGLLPSFYVYCCPYMQINPPDGPYIMCVYPMGKHP